MNLRATIALVLLGAAPLCSQAAVRTVDFRGYVLRYDDSLLTLAGTAELGNDGFSYFTVNRKQFQAASGHESTTTFTPVFEIEAKTDSYLISYQGWSQASFLMANGGAVRYDARISDDLHGGHATDEAFNDTFQIDAKNGPDGLRETWINQFGHSFFHDTRQLTLRTETSVYLDARPTDSRAQFEFMDQAGANDEVFQFGLAVGSVQVVPEPGTVLLSALGLAVVAVRARARRGGTPRRESSRESSRT